jgi:hypothetical protein
MSIVLPGKPQSRLQGLAIAYWNNLHLNVRERQLPLSLLKLFDST